MEFNSTLHEHTENDRDEPYLKKTKLHNGVGSPPSVDSEDLTTLAQPQSIFRQVSNSTKLPKTAFVLYLNSSKDSFYSLNPDASFSDFQTYALQIWRSLPQTEKNIWLQKEIDSRKEFFQQVQGVLDPVTTVPTEEKKSLSSSKLAFPTFVQAMRDQVLLENPTFTYNEIQKELSKVWKNMSREEKLIWSNAELDTPLPSTTKRSSYPRRTASLPVPPKSAYNLFYQCARKQLLLEFPDLPGKDIPGICSELWKNLPATERALWQSDAENDRVRYQRDCAHHNSVSDQKSATEKQPSEALNETSSSASSGTDDKNKTPSTARTKHKSPKKEKGEAQQKSNKRTPKKQNSKSTISPTSIPFPEESLRVTSGDYFSSTSLINGSQSLDDDRILLSGEENSLKIPSHDSFFEDNLGYDNTLFFDSDPFHADLDLFPGLGSPQSHRQLDSKHFLHEDLSLFGHDSISNFRL